MCGIAGFIGNGTREALERCGQELAHRGPDDSGLYVENGIGLVFRRLAIIDTSPAGHQPMWNADKTLGIIFNGEIYNYRALRDELRRAGILQRSASDTEVILQLFEREGVKSFEKLVGMFAIAIVDTKKRSLTLARDRMGEKPLYWAVKKGTLVFASELGALMASGLVEKEVDESSLSKYLLFDYVPAPHTMITGIEKLHPGTWLTYREGSVMRGTFWEPPKTLTKLTYQEAQNEFDARMHESIRGQLISDVPLGVFLSGGIDSSTVAWYATQNAPGKVETFSMAFDDVSFDESNYARDVARTLGTEHHEQMVTGKQAIELVPRIAEICSEPVADASVIPTTLLSQFAREHVTVALGGDGADELFAGYPTFSAEHLYKYYRRLPRSLKIFGERFIESLPASDSNFGLAFSLKKFVGSSEEDLYKRHMEWLGSFSSSARAALLSRNESSDVYEDVLRYQSEYELPDEMNRLLYVYARTYLMDGVLAKVDRASMSASLETRAPFLDHHVVELAFSLPYEWKYRDFGTKLFLKKRMHGRLPDSILDRKKKGFGVPLSRWLKNELKPLRDELLSPGELRKHGYFSESYVRKLCEEHDASRNDNRKQIWNLMVFQMWYNRWIR